MRCFGIWPVSWGDVPLFWMSWIRFRARKPSPYSGTLWHSSWTELVISINSLNAAFLMFALCHSHIVVFRIFLSVRGNIHSIWTWWSFANLDGRISSHYIYKRWKRWSTYGSKISSRKLLNMDSEFQPLLSSNRLITKSNNYDILLPWLGTGLLTRWAFIFFESFSLKSI